MALLIDVPTQVDFDLWRNFKVLIAPRGIKDIDYDPTYLIEFYKEISFEDGWIGCPLLQTNALNYLNQGDKKGQTI